MSKVNHLDSVIFLGTGASSSLPNVLCITNDKSACKVCPLALTKEGIKNRRRNCSLLVRWYDKEGKLRNILIDCGKTFYEASLEFLLPLKITTIDAVILTHGHADAMFGLDDLRSWSWTKDGGIPVYLNRSTMDVVKSTFPYLVDKAKATGGGEVPTLRFRVIDEYKKFTVEGLEFTPINVEHGVQFGCKAYMSLGFRFKNVTYLSDVSKIPGEVRDKLDGTKLLIIDCLRELYYPSHYGFQEAISEVVRYRPLNTYFVGMGHTLEHSEFLKKCVKVSNTKLPGHLVEPAFDGLILEFRDNAQKEILSSSLV